MKIISVKNPQYSRSDKSTIDVDVEFDNGPNWPHKGRTLRYTCAAHDRESHGIELWSGLIDGKHGTIAPYPGPTPDQIKSVFMGDVAHAYALSQEVMLRVQDAVVLGDAKLTSPDVVAWAQFRKVLRAIQETGEGTLPPTPPLPKGI